MNGDGAVTGGRRQGFLKTSSSWRLLEEQRQLGLRNKSYDVSPLPQDSGSVFTSLSTSTEATVLASGSGTSRPAPVKAATTPAFSPLEHPPEGVRRQRGGSMVSRDGSIIPSDLLSGSSSPADSGCIRDPSLSDYSYSKRSDGTAPTEPESSYSWDEDSGGWDFSLRNSGPDGHGCYESDFNRRLYDHSDSYPDRRSSPVGRCEEPGRKLSEDYNDGRFRRMGADDIYTRSPRMHESYERTPTRMNELHRFDRPPGLNDPSDRYQARMDDSCDQMNGRRYNDNGYDRFRVQEDGYGHARSRRIQDDYTYVRTSDPSESFGAGIHLCREDSYSWRRQWEAERAIIREKQGILHERGRQHSSVGAIPMDGPSYSQLPSNDERVMVEIAPGTRVRLRRSNETLQAIANDMYLPATCFGCEIEILCISDAEYVVCPQCKVVSPMEAASVGEQPPKEECYGLGLGFTYDHLFQTQSEIWLERSAS